MRLLHTMIRVGNLQKSIDFYTQVLGMTLRKLKEYPEGRFTLAFLGYGDDKSQSEIELTYNWDTSHYELGKGFGHLAFEVEDIYQTCSTMRSHGVEITREPGPMKHGTTVIAFLKDPDGYMIELIEKKNKTP